MICGRTYLPTGPYWIRPHGEPRTTHLFRVVDGLGRRISEPMKRNDARRLCYLLNDVFESAMIARLRLIVPVKE